MEVVLNVILILCIFSMGSLFGSFFSLATYRLPRKQDIIATRSYCPNCKHRLEFFDLIPVLSYLFRGAKCKYCGVGISPRYFLLEISNGLLFVLLYLLIGYNLKLALVVVIYAVIFVLIGSYIMKSKMSKEELDEVSKMVEEKKLSKKAGVFISELVIALVLFIITLVTVIMVNRNAKDKLNVSLVESRAQSLLQKNIEICLLADFDNLNSYEFSKEIDGITYNVNSAITSIYENNNSKKDIVKEIDVTVSYSYNGENYNLNTKTLKGKM